MIAYTDKALQTIQENTTRLYAKLGSLKPSDGLDADDIRSLMYCLRSFGDEARSEERRRQRDRAVRR